MTNHTPASLRWAAVRCSILIVSLCLSLPRVASQSAHSPPLLHSPSVPTPAVSPAPEDRQDVSPLPLAHRTSGGRSGSLGGLRRRGIGFSVGEKSLRGWGRDVELLYPAVRASPAGVSVVEKAAGGENVALKEGMTKSKPGDGDSAVVRNAFTLTGDKKGISSGLFGKASGVGAEIAIKKIAFEGYYPSGENKTHKTFPTTTSKDKRLEKHQPSSPSLSSKYHTVDETQYDISSKNSLPEKIVFLLSYISQFNSSEVPQKTGARSSNPTPAFPAPLSTSHFKVWEDFSTVLKSLKNKQNSYKSKNPKLPDTGVQVFFRANTMSSSRSGFHQREDEHDPREEIRPADSSEGNDETSQLTSVIGTRVTRVSDRAAGLSYPQSSRRAPGTRQQDVILNFRAAEGKANHKLMGEVDRSSITRQLRGQSTSYTKPHVGEVETEGAVIYTRIDHHLPDKDRQMNSFRNLSRKTFSLSGVSTLPRYDISPCRNNRDETCMRFKLGKKIPKGTKAPLRINSTSKLRHTDGNSVLRSGTVKHGKEHADAGDSFTRLRRKTLMNVSSFHAKSSLTNNGSHFNSFPKEDPDSDIIRAKRLFSPFDTTGSPVKYVNDKITVAKREKIDAEDQRGRLPLSPGQENAVQSYSVKPGERIPTMKYERPKPFIVWKGKSIHDGAPSGKQDEQNAINYRTGPRFLRVLADIERKPFPNKGKHRKGKHTSERKNAKRMPLPAPASSSLIEPSEYKILKVSPRRNMTNGEGVARKKISPSGNSSGMKEHEHIANMSHFSDSTDKSLFGSTHLHVPGAGRLPFTEKNTRAASNRHDVAGVGMQAEEENIRVAVSKRRVVNPIKRVAGRMQSTPLSSNSFSLTGEVHKDYTRKGSHSRKLLQFQEDTQDKGEETPRRNIPKPKNKGTTTTKNNTREHDVTQETSPSLRNTTRGVMDGRGNTTGTSFYSKGEGHQKTQGINYSHFPPGFGGIDEGEGCNCWPTYDESFKHEVECRCQGEHLIKLPKNISTDVDRLTITKMGIESLGPANLSSFSSSLQEMWVSAGEAILSQFQGYIEWL
ncbi:uncharacterized protein LOC122242112, partial [Penaeus japonicus]|uniref:uncharacterized protein LOC122242112 n=1 Tax=Penaeus japonicus TaxID=27405 RepID=UPI001C7142C3